MTGRRYHHAEPARGDETPLSARCATISSPGSIEARGRGACARRHRGRQGRFAAGGDVKFMAALRQRRKRSDDLCDPSSSRANERRAGVSAAFEIPTYRRRSTVSRPGRGLRPRPRLRPPCRRPRTARLGASFVFPHRAPSRIGGGTSYSLTRLAERRRWLVISSSAGGASSSFGRGARSRSRESRWCLPRS